MTWRLIHIWEAADVTLAAAAVGRLRTAEGCDDVYRRCREYLYGRYWDEISREFKPGQGALDGSIDRWIEILWTISNGPAYNSPFLQSLASFLKAPGVRLGGFFDAWRVACDAPSMQSDGVCSVREAIKHLNTFRNRFAHVPFPHDPLKRVWEELEKVTCDVFGLEGDSTNTSWIIPCNDGGTLCGGFADAQSLVRGLTVEQLPKGIEEHPGTFVFLRSIKPKEWESWNSGPLLYLDSMIRAHILTRLRNRETGTWEFTRFRAEANAIFTVDNENWLELLPIPKDKDYPLLNEAKSASVDSSGDQTLSVTSSAVEDREPLDTNKTLESFDDALDAIRKGRFELAVPFLRDYAKQRPNYHIAWLRLGVTLRESAVRKGESDRAAASTELDESVSSLSKAAGHVDPAYQAAAHYERSKSLFQKWKLSKSAEELTAALEAADESIKIGDEDRFTSWREYLDRRKTESAARDGTPPPEANSD